jgi:HYR domain/Calcium-binding EGF domain
MSVPGSSRWIARVAIAIVFAAGSTLAFTSSAPSTLAVGAQAPRPSAGKCPAGYVAKGDACEDVDECVTNNGGCAEGTQCVNTPGLWQCGTSCPPGFTGAAGACQDVNECEAGNGGCDALTMCTNTPGGRSCGTCPDGHAGDGYIGCVDVNECADGDCAPILERRARARDNIPPVITTPGTVTAAANSPAGAAVNFTVTAKDNVDGTVPVTCTPASGATFAVGATKVTCTAVDKKGNKGSSILTVTVTKE